MLHIDVPLDILRTTTLQQQHATTFSRVSSFSMQIQETIANGTSTIKTATTVIFIVLSYSFLGSILLYTDNINIKAFGLKITFSNFYLTKIIKL